MIVPRIWQCLAQARALLQDSIPYEQLEADDDLGGNWYQQPPIA